MSGLPTPPMEDHSSRRSSKIANSKTAHRSSKRSSSSHDHGAVVIDGRHKRVWKACERCRMKKTKCDGESPCKRCKDDGLVCTAGSRKKTEFKQLPRGYAEVLENTQYALIATVQKLYTMVRNNESWDLGEPEMNDRGQPVIHDIASKLGCIRPSPDLPYAFPEGADDFAELQAQLQAARAEMGAHDIGNHNSSNNNNNNGSRKGSDSVSSSPALDRTDRASSSESDHSALSKDYNQMLWQQQQQQQSALLHAKANVPSSPAKQARVKLEPVVPTIRNSSYDEDYAPRASFESMPSPVYSDFPPASPMFRNASPFSPWSGGDEFLGQAHALDLTAHYMRQGQQQQQYAAPRSAPMYVAAGGAAAGQAGGAAPMDADMFKAMQLADGMNFADGTIRPGMLDCSSMDLADQMDNIMFTPGEFESNMGLV
ncbi:C6 transcription factor [Phlyctema vagabunda]|uniref:C6 transcription factor n=1 Tax=Phlyctema vagabunda TaxID=108571 RepID=A0ABR4PB02_9HELO